MRSLSLAVILLLLLRIAYGSTEKGEELRPSETPPIPDCQQGECTQKEEYLRKVTDCESGSSDCLNAIQDGSDINESPAKRGPISKNSYLFMKLHPVLNRAVDSNLMNVPTRFRRISVRLGSEFLGKRSGVGEEEEEVRRGRRVPGTELLGKRNVEMLGKRGGEFLGKRGTEFLGKRGNEFLGKRNEFLGKRNEFLGKRNEFLGKRSNEFLGKRGNEFLGKRNEFLGKRNEFLGKRNEFLGKRNEFLGKRNGLRMWMCREGEDCLPFETRVLLQYFKVGGGAEVDSPEEGCPFRCTPPDRRQATQLNPLYFFEKL